jgi:hypothetical protein
MSEMSASPRSAPEGLFRLAWQDRTLRLVVLVALVIRIVLAVAALERGTAEAPDTHTYLEPTQSLLTTFRFDSNQAPELSRTPGYSMLLAMGVISGRVFPTTLALQVILSTVTTFGVAVLALGMGCTRRVAVLAAAIFAVEPTALIYVSKLLTETLFTALVTGVLIAITIWARRRGWGPLITAAALVGAAALVRPVAYYAPVPLALLVLVIAYRYHHVPFRQAALSAALCLTIAGAPLAAWRVRNAVVADYDRFTAIADINLLYWRGAGVVARRSGRPLEDVQAQFRRELDEDAPLVATGRYARGRERAERYREIRRRGTAIIKNDPVAVALDGIASVSRIILGRETSEWGVLLGMTALSPAWRTLRVLLTFAWLPLVVAAIVGLVRVRWDVPVVLPGLLVAVYLVVLSAGPESSARFRLAFIPVVCVFAAAGVVRVRHGASAAATTVRHAG